MTKSIVSKVLVVDDDPDIREAIEQGLEVPGFELQILTAHNAVTALQIAKEEKPEVIIVDLQMPMGTGFDLATELRADRSLERVKLLMLTALDTPQNLWESIDRDIDDFLPKPFDFAELEARVKALLLKEKGTATQI